MKSEPTNSMPISRLGNYHISTRTKICATTVALIAAVVAVILSTTFGTVGIVCAVVGGCTIIGVALAALFYIRRNARKQDTGSSIAETPKPLSTTLIELSTPIAVAGTNSTPVQTAPAVLEIDSKGTNLDQPQPPMTLSTSSSETGNAVDKLPTPVQTAPAVLEIDSKGTNLDQPQPPMTLPTNSSETGNAVDKLPTPVQTAPALKVIVPTDTYPQTGAFSDIDSTRWVRINLPFFFKTRDDFSKHSFLTPSPLIGTSKFVPQSMVVHLIQDKKDSSRHEKFVEGDKITNMEAVMHTFVTLICKIFMTRDCYRNVGQKGVDTKKEFDGTQFRQGILSTAIPPDFETPEVIMKLLQVEEGKMECTEDESIILSNSLAKEIPDPVNKGSVYETNLKKLMIYHLTRTHSLPAKTEIKSEHIFRLSGAKQYLEQLIVNIPRENIIDSLEGKFIQCPNHSLISLEAFFNVYVEQITNEFKVLNPNTPQGYIYTIDPPSVFVQALSNQAAIPNRLQALAFKFLDSRLFSNMKVLAITDLADSTIISFYEKFLRKVQIKNQDNIYEEGGLLDKNPGLALVLHNNGDGFGQNIEFDGKSRQDRMIGQNSNAAYVLRRDREFDPSTIIVS